MQYLLIVNSTYNPNKKTTAGNEQLFRRIMPAGNEQLFRKIMPTTVITLPYNEL